MIQARWEEIKRLFGLAMELPEGERAPFLERECAGDQDLADQVERLLQSDGGARDFLEPPPKDEIEKPMRILSFDFRGCRLGEFELLERIGRGATCVVWLARQESLGREIAVKILAPHLCQAPERLKRFQKEALAASRLRHPNIVSVLTVGEQEGVHYIAMEHVRGRSLQDLLVAARATSEASVSEPHAHSPAPLDLKASARIVQKIAEALEHCHARGVVHRDVKPQNVLIDERGDPRIIDFGLARILEEEGITDTGTVMGTPHYMSPEQVMALGDEIDLRTDIYSLGALLYELLTLERLFERSAPAEVAYKIVNDEPVPVRKINPDVPWALAGICAKALRKNPAERYRSAGEMASDLDRFLRGRSVRAPRPSWLRELHHFVFYRKPWIAASVVVTGFTLAIFLSPRANPVQAAGSETPPVLSPSEKAEQRKARLEAAWRVIREYEAEEALAEAEKRQVDEEEKAKVEEAWKVIHHLESLLPNEPIITKE